MPLLGAKNKAQLLKRLTSRWGEDDDEPAKKVAKRPSADPSVIKRPANEEQVLKRPAAKRPASAIEDETDEETQAKQRDRNKDGWLKRNLKSGLKQVCRRHVECVYIYGITSVKH